MAPLDEIRKLKQQAKEPKLPKKRKPIPKKSKKKRAADAIAGNDLDEWFQERRKEMKGFCANCGRRSSAQDELMYRFSIAHILPKAYFESIKTHPDNWIELCFWGEGSCHTNMDNLTVDMTEMACWDEIVVKFQKMYPSIAAKEKKRIPNLLFQYINTDE